MKIINLLLSLIADFIGFVVGTFKNILKIFFSIAIITVILYFIFDQSYLFVVIPLAIGIFISLKNTIEGLKKGY